MITTTLRKRSRSFVKRKILYIVSDVYKNKEHGIEAKDVRNKSRMLVEENDCGIKEKNL